MGSRPGLCPHHRRAARLSAGAVWLIGDGQRGLGHQRAQIHAAAILHHPQFDAAAIAALSGVIARPLLQRAGFQAGGANDPGALRVLLGLYAGAPLALRLVAITALAAFYRRARI